MHDILNRFRKAVNETIDKYGGKKYLIAIFTLIAVVSISVFVRAPFAFYDEQIHYIRAVGISNGQFLSYSQSNKESDFGHSVDVAIPKFISLHQDNEDRIAIDWIDEGSSLELSGEEGYHRNTSAAPYNPVAYLAPALGGLVADVLGMTVLEGFILMRLFGAIVSVGIVILAVVVSPRKFRWVVVSISLLPMSIASFAAITADSFTVAISLLFMAYAMRVVHAIRQSKLTSLNVIFLFLISTLLIGSKMPAFLMVGVVLAILLVYWRDISRLHRSLLVSIILITALATLTWVYLVKDINTGAFWGRDVDTFRQLSFIMENPKAFLINLVSSILGFPYYEIPYTLYADHPRYENIPFLIDMVLMTGIFMSASIDMKYNKTDKKQKRLYSLQLVLFTGIVIVIFTLLYLQYNPVGMVDRIEGIQSRYFLPYLPLVAMTPYVFRLSPKLRRVAVTAPFVGVATYLIFITIQIV